MGRDCASESVPITLAEADQRTTSERRHQLRLTSPPLPSKGIPLSGLAHGHQTVNGGHLDGMGQFGRPDGARATEARIGQRRADKRGLGITALEPTRGR